MRRFLILLAVLTLLGLALGCSRPQPAPLPVEHLTLRYRDQDVTLPLPSPFPGERGWSVMNAGLWEPLDVRWLAGPPRRGTALVDRTAPDWVTVLPPGVDEVDGIPIRVAVRGFKPGEADDRDPELDPDERDFFALLGILWALSWRH